MAAKERPLLALAVVLEETDTEFACGSALDDVCAALLRTVDGRGVT